MPYQANVSALLACVFISLLKNLTLGAAIDCRNAQNPRDSSCIKVKDGTRVRATLNKDFAYLLASFLDTNMVEEPTWCILFLFSLYILNLSTLRYNKSPDKWSKIPLFSFLKVSLGRCVMEPWRFRKTFAVTISIYVIPTKLHVIEDAFQL